MAVEWVLAACVACVFGSVGLIGIGWWGRSQVDAEEDRADDAERALERAKLKAAETEIGELRKAFGAHAKAARELEATKAQLIRMATDAGGDPADLAQLLRDRVAGGGPDRDPPAPADRKAGGGPSEP